MPMLRCYGSTRLARSGMESVVSIGVFDGVHLGHQEVLSRAVAAARDVSLPAVVVTFDRHPLATLRPGAEPPALATLERNLSLIERCGVDACLVLAFDREMAETTAERFFAEVLVEGLGIRRAVIGADFAFGKGREGDSEWLAQRVEVNVVQPVKLDGGHVSSSAIRDAVMNGEVERAARMLGRPHCLEGVVERGQALGRELGFPTANLRPLESQLPPASGVYAGSAQFEGGRYSAAISVGTRPAVGGDDLAIEAHLLDYAGASLYGRALRIEFTERLRDELDFPSLAELRQAIAKDVERVRHAVK